MPPPRITQAYVKKLSDAFIADVKRAKNLYETIALQGQSFDTAKGIHTPISKFDSRDLAQFIFFEIAAKFEEYAKLMFQAEVRSVIKITRDQAEFVMGDADNGLSSKLGWGAPAMLQSRAKNLMGSNSKFFGDLQAHLPQHYQRLIECHTVRNRLAHSGGTAQSKYVKLLDGYGITKAQRQGLSVGRLLQDYPVKSAKNRRYFFLYLNAYTEFAEKTKQLLP